MVTTIDNYMKKSLKDRTKHIDLNIPCLLRGGNSTQHRGVLAQYLKTEFPNGYKINLCHYCGDDRCSTPKHLYWGTSAENYADMKRHGTLFKGWDLLVQQHGLAEARSIMRQIGSGGWVKGGKANAGRSKSATHKENLRTAAFAKNGGFSRL